MNTTTHTFIECECGTHILRLESEIIQYGKPTPPPTKFITEGIKPISYEVKESEKTEQTFFLDLFNHHNVNPTIWHRVKVAYNYIVTGNLEHNDMILTSKEAKKLANFINNNTQSK